MSQADLGTLAELLADDLVYTHSNAEHDTKTSYIERVATQNLVYVDIARPEERIVLAGETAIVAGRMTARIRVGGEERHLDNRSLAVWVNRAGRWELLAFQGTMIPKA